MVMRLVTWNVRRINMSITFALSSVTGELYENKTNLKSKLSQGKEMVSFAYSHDFVGKYRVPLTRVCL